MIDFEKQGRTLKTRGLVYTPEQMEGLGIKVIFNSTGVFLESFIQDFHVVNKKGTPQGNVLVETSLLRSKKKEAGKLLEIVSVIVFRNIVKKNLFCLFSGELYKGTRDWFELMN